MPTTEPPILKTSGPAELLAAMPSITGFTARNSVVVALFRGKRTCGALRIDIPTDVRTRTARAVADTLIAMIERQGIADGVAPVLYTDATFEEQRGIPHLELWRTIEMRMRRAGFRIVEGCCVAADGWASYLDRRRPRGGHPLQLIHENPVALEAAFHAGAVTDIAVLCELPPADPGLARNVAHQALLLTTLGMEVDAFGNRYRAEADPIETAEACVDLPSDELTAYILSTIIAAADLPVARDIMLLTMAFGRDVGERTVELNERAFERQARTGETLDEIAASQFASGEKSLDDDETLYMIGRSKRMPDPARITAAIDALRLAATHAPPPLRAGVLCVLAWMLWARGALSPASAMLDLAAELDPALRMVDTLGMLLASGPPQWAYDHHAAARKRLAG